MKYLDWRYANIVCVCVHVCCPIIYTLTDNIVIITLNHNNFSSIHFIYARLYNTHKLGPNDKSKQ